MATFTNHVSNAGTNLRSTGTDEEIPVGKRELKFSDEFLLSLIEKGHIPEEKDLADTYYSLNDEFESSSDEDDLPDDNVEMSDSEYRDMFEIMEDALDLNASVLSRRGGSGDVPSHSFDELRPAADEPERIGFSRSHVTDLPRENRTVSGPSPRAKITVEQKRPATAMPASERPLSLFTENVVEQRIGNMRQRCVEALGADLFERAYVIAKQLRFDDFSKNAVTRQELNNLVPDSGQCMNLEQLVYLENELKVT